METIEQIISKHEAFLKEAPRRHLVLVKNQRGILAGLFYSTNPDCPGVAVQFVDDELCYVFNNEPRWQVVGVYENTNKFFDEKRALERSRLNENA